MTVGLRGATSHPVSEECDTLSLTAARAGFRMLRAGPAARCPDGRPTARAGAVAVSHVPRRVGRAARALEVPTPVPPGSWPCPPASPPGDHGPRTRRHGPNPDRGDAGRIGPTPLGPPDGLCGPVRSDRHSPVQGAAAHRTPPDRPSAQPEPHRRTKWCGPPSAPWPRAVPPRPHITEAVIAAPLHRRPACGDVTNQMRGRKQAPASSAGLESRTFHLRRAPAF